jgi:putative hydrolase of the HAD superfamily
MAGESAITTVLFDAGGTLVHLDYFFLHKELRQAGITISRRAIRQAEYASRAEIDRRLRGLVMDVDETRRRPYFAVLLDQLGVDTATAQRLVERFDAAHARANLWRVMLPSTPPILRELRERGLTLGVVSNADGRIATILQQCGIEQFFQVVIDSHVVGVEKPDPHIFHLALTQAQARPEQAIFVGDIYGIDVLGAERAGIRPLLLDILDSYAGVQCEKIRHLSELRTIVCNSGQLLA